ncbi:hypothetical protein Dda_4175 [Drechslerella dactyloides]|uniref:Uncharacterized protein n=1 Tax=Drechslerella dactyloides TaxID=74499 RepID=A0AAD6NKL7_DREDA|nr:hypothetical protein Dda_4175 [Drechslerella dactyloides]
MWPFIRISLEPLFTLLSRRPVPFSIRWRYFAFTPGFLLINSIKYFPWLFSSAYRAYYIPSAHGTHQIRFIVFEPTYSAASPSRSKPRPLHLVVHGGAFLQGLAEQDAYIANRVCRETGAVTVSVQYRGAPRFPFPAAHDDVDDVLAHLLSPEWVQRFNIDLNNVTVSGVSAGGNLALSASLHHIGRIAAAVALCTVVELRKAPWEKPIPANYPKSDPLAFMLPVFDAYAGPERQKNLTNERLNVILAPADKLPRDMLFLVPTKDILLHEQTVLVERLKKETEGSGRRVETVFYEDEIHGWIDSQPPAKLLSTLPFHQNPDFVNRGDTLTEIDKRCSRPGGRAALVGLGGVGKSQLAIEYFFNVREKPQRIQVFWVYGSSTAKFVAAYKDIADKLQLPGRDDSTANMLHLVHNWLCSEDSGRWFMVLDSADDKNLFFPQEHSAASKGSVSSIKLADFLPKSQNGSILITSRNRDLARKLIGRDIDVLEIQQMSLDEGLRLLQNKLSRPSKPVVELRSGPDSEPAKALLAALGYMPLAISQAAAYINQRYPPVTIQGYLQQFHDSDERREELLTRESLDLCREEGASNSILATYQISFNPQGIPGFMIWNHFDGNPDAENGRNRRHKIDSDLGFLIDLSLVATNPDGDTFVMHPLVQFATRTCLKSMKIEGRVRQKFLAVLSEEFPYGDIGTWSQCQLLLPHVEPWVNMQLTNNEDAACWTKVMTKAAWYLQGRGLYTQAKFMLRRSWETGKQVLGINHPYTFVSARLLATVLSLQGSSEEAEQILQGVLELDKNQLDCRHCLGFVLHSKGKYEEAERLFRQLSKEYEEREGKKVLSTLMVLNNRAAALEALGEFGEAESIIRQLETRSSAHNIKEMSPANTRLLDNEAGEAPESRFTHSSSFLPLGLSRPLKTPPRAMRIAVALLTCIAVFLGLSFSHLGPSLAAESKFAFNFHSSPSTHDTSRPLILYAYHETENARRNALFFIAHGLHAAADFVFILNGETNLTESLPVASNIRSVQRSNTCYDMGAYKEVLTADDGAVLKRYSRFILMNASIRGPFLPPWSRECWSDVFLEKVTDTTKLVGMTYNCKSYFGFPHIQSMILATDRTGLDAILPRLSCASDWMSAVYMESNTTEAIWDAGYSVFALMSAYSSHSDYPAVCTNGDVLFEGAYFGSTLHPYDTVFQKANRNYGVNTLARLTEWTDAAGYSSWEVCGRGAREKMGPLGGWGRWNQTPFE